MKKNSFIDGFKSKIVLKISGRNTERFIRKLASNNINLLKIKYHKRNIIEITIYKEDYEKVLKLKSIYEINIVDASGLIKIKNVFKTNKILILFLIIGISLLVLLTNTIFKVEVVHTSSDIRTLLTNELKNYGIDVYTLKKSFKQIEQIKKSILDKYPDKIEWLEIETVGVKYIVRVELREIIKKEENTTTRNVVASKDALIKKVIAESGMIIKNINSYVKKGDVIISGNITLNEENKGVVDAKGKVYGEVWYTTTVEYPFNYYEERLTGNCKNIISFKFLNKSFDLFSTYKNKKVTSEVIVENKLLPIKLVKEKWEELIIVDQVLTEEEAIEKAVELANSKMKNDLSEDEYIIDNKVLKVDIKDNKVVLDIFFIVYEDITDYSEIVPEIPEEIEE